MEIDGKDFEMLSGNRKRSSIQDEKPMQWKVRRYDTPSNKFETLKGFDDSRDQYRRSIFNLMIVGRSGLGKSTFVNNLILPENNVENLPPLERPGKTVQINTTTVELTENAVSLKLTLIDTPGFGDSSDNSECWGPVVEYIESKYSEYMLAQNRVDRNHIVDNRVHACLYFIRPTGLDLSPLDLEFMNRIHNRVNIIPVIAKADTLIPNVCAHFKKTILDQIKTNNIKIYDFPEAAAAISLGSTMGEGREIDLADIRAKRNRQPFAIVCADAIIEIGGNKVRGRSYPWGSVDVDNLDHNDFAALRTLLFSYHLQDIKDRTDQVLFEEYRREQMSNFVRDSLFYLTDGKDLMSQIDEGKRKFEANILEIALDSAFANSVD